MNLENEPALKANLVRELKGRTDADPASLADYIVALLRHEKSADQLFAYCLEQLNEFFLPGQAEPFLRSLFDALQSGMAFSESAPIASSSNKASSDGGKERDFLPLLDESTRTGERRRRRSSVSAEIVVDRLPEETGDEEVRRYFSDSFGPIASISRTSLTSMAVRFEDPRDAVRAVKSPNAVLGNRFIKTFFPSARGASAPDMRGGRIAKTRAAPLTRAQAKMISPEKLEERANQRQQRLQALLSVQRQREELVKRYIQQQKEILAKLDDSSTGPAERAALKETLVSLDRSISEFDSVNNTGPLTSASSPAVANSTAPAMSRKSFKMDLRPGTFIMTPVPALLRNDLDAFRKILVGYGASFTHMKYDEETKSALIEYSNRPEASKVCTLPLIASFRCRHLLR